MATIDIDKISRSDISPEVLEVYKRVKRMFADDEDRKVWKENRKKNWAAAYPLDTEEEGIWTAKEKAAMMKKGQIPIGVNDLAKGVQGACAVITSKSPGINVTPIGSNDLYVSELLKRGWDYVIARNGGPITFYDWVKECKLSGLACIEAKHDPSKGIFGKVTIGQIDPTTYYYDKKSQKLDHSDVDFGKAHLVAKQYALETYDGLTEDDLIFTEISQDEAKDDPKRDDYVAGKDNYALSADDVSKGPTDDKEQEENVWEIEDWELAKVKELWLMVPSQERPGEFDREIYKGYGDIELAGWQIGIDKKTAIKQGQAIQMDPMTGEPVPIITSTEAVIWPRRVEKRIQRIIVGKKLISKEVNPLGIDADGEPILPLITIQHDRTLKGYPTGPVTRAWEISKSRNKRRMQSIYVVSKNIDAPIVMPQGSKWVKDEEHGDHIEVGKDVPFAPTRLLPGTTSAELANMEMRDKEDINDEFDMSDVIRGKIPAGQSNIAGRTVLALQEMVGVMSQPFTLVFEAGLERVGRAAISLMLRTWPKSMWIRLIEPDELGSWQPDKEIQMGPDGQPVKPEPSAIQQKWENAIARITGEDGKEPLSMIDLDVKIVGGSTAPTNRLAKAQVAMEMLKVGAYDVEAVLDYSNDPKKDEIVQRIEMKRKQELEAIAQGQAAKQASKGV